MSLDQLNEAIEKVKAGEKIAAVKMLSDYLRAIPESETAWLWLAVCVSLPDQKRFCLKKALSINPNNENARQALERLESPPPAVPTLADLLEHQAEPVGQPTPASTRPAAEPANSEKAPQTTAPASGRDNLPVVPMATVGRYVRAILLPNERVLAVAKFHWLIYFRSMLFLALAFLLAKTVYSFASSGSSNSNDALMVALICSAPFWLTGLSWFVRAFLLRQTTEFALTDHRVIGKYGIIQRQSLELVLGKVESVIINQSLSGRLFNYGTLVVIGSGGTRQAFPFISAPMELKKNIQMILRR
jgi:hypothetical protein